MADNLKSQLFSGVFYTALAKYSGVVISLVVAGVLARLLSPDDFGIVAIATVIIAFFNLFTDMGVSPAIVQHKTLTREELSDIFSFTVWTGIGISALFFAASWLIAGYYNSDILRTLCQLLSVNLFFASATIVPGALFYRNKEFKFIAVRSFVIQISAGAAAVTAALCGAGLYALIINPIVSSILIFAISYQRYPQRLRLTLGLTVLRKIFSYSAYQFLFNVINYFSRNLDKLLIGKYMGMSDLGYYEKSYRLMMLPLQNITQVITPVMHPIFSDFQDDKGKLATSYERILRFYFGTLTAVASCIAVTFTVNFAQCYWQMYRVTFRRSVLPFVRQLLSPMAVSLLMAAILLPIQYATEGINIFLTIIVKSIVSFTIFGGYIQVTREYDLFGKIRSMAGKGK